MRLSHFSFSILLSAALLYLCACSKPQTQNTVPAEPPMADFIQFQYAVYFLPLHTKDPSIVLRELLAKKYSDLKLVEKLPEKPDEMFLKAALETDVQHQYVPPDLHELSYFGHGLTQKQKQDLQKSREAFIVSFAHPKKDVWRALRTADELVEEIAMQTGGLIWDEETRRIFTPSAWHKTSLESWNDAIPEISSQITVHLYQSDESVRAISLGMRKAGLPDVIVADFPWSSQSQMGNVIDMFCQAMVEGAGVSKSGKFKLDVREIRNSEVRDEQLKGMGPSGTGKACLSLKPGKWEDGDPKNRLIELAFDAYPGSDVHIRQENMIDSLFGAHDSTSRIEHGKELLDASHKAREKLPELQKAFNSGLEPGEYILLKAPFPTPAGGREWMWVEVTKWGKNQIKGILSNDPFEIPDMHSGQAVVIREEDIFDYLRKYQDKHEEGNTTGEIIRKQETPGEPKTTKASSSVVPDCGMN
jgi:uncharacterized protein YegJ (DUF2314 family)